MSKQSQKEAVFTAVQNILAEDGMSINEGEAVVLSKEQRAQVNGILFEGFKGETIELSKPYATDAKLRGFISGLQSNWLRKDKRLNGGITYVSKNPGSRAGSGDASLKAMRTLLNTLTDAADRAEVQAHIDARLAEIASSKVKSVTIDYSVLPADLQAKFSK